MSTGARRDFEERERGWRGPGGLRGGVAKTPGRGKRRRNRGNRGGPGPRGPAALAQPAPPRGGPRVDREKLGGHHRADDFKGVEVHPRDEIAIYTWRDATAREIGDLLAEVHPAARRRGARLSLALVYPDRRGMTVIRPAAVLFTSRPGPDDGKSLAQLGFEIGDFLDVAIH